MKEALGAFVRHAPRLALGVGLGAATALVTCLAWIPSARFSGEVPALTLGAGLAHAASGALLGGRLLDARRTPTGAHAALLGAVASLLAVILFAPCFAWYVSEGGTHTKGVVSYLALTFYVGVFSFLGAGWALLLVSAGVAWALWRVATPR